MLAFFCGYIDSEIVNFNCLKDGYKKWIHANNLVGIQLFCISNFTCIFIRVYVFVNFYNFAMVVISARC